MRPLGFEHIYELASDVGHAGHFFDFAGTVQLFEPCVPIRVHPTLIILEMFAGAYAFAVWRELIPCDGWRYAYEWRDDRDNWFQSYGNENWEFAENGLMQNRFASINDLPIVEADRKFHWPQGRRPDDHPGIFELGL
jgi:hypothetical protein